MSAGMIALRYVLPAVVVIAGAIVMSLGSESEVEGGAGIAGAGLAIFAMNWLIRASTEGDREREREEAAREYFDEHGYWPDEANARGGAAPSASPPASATLAPTPGARVTQRRLDRPARPRTRGPSHG
jgi:hypothetical protein